ncbi:DUF4003 family protein [Exiguobacterium sp. B2(2022)]|uniref:DUF4003 family protein n=1 Tax=Exiguobacterium sp. B2(2022) TaxID=2992755 RepID=UPI00237A0BA2|nr:DUF4003 family protein [Exiguobacterium sp. B2(2022)]MDE0564127.1 DUF4003 domain-containing protein [Exiguobacterium sp. B2(2022)]
MTHYERYVEALDAIKDATKWELTDDFRRLMAIHYAIHDTPFEASRFSNARDTLKQKTKMFSKFRGSQNLVWLSFLDAKYEDIGTAIDEALRLDTLLDRKHFRFSSLRPFLANQLINVEEPERRLNEATDLYQTFKQHHPWLTSEEDLLSALVLVQAFDDVIDLNERIEQHYSLLKDRLSKSNELQLVSHLLTFSESAPEEAVSRLLAWKSQLDDVQISIRREQLPALALLSIVAEPNADAVHAIQEIVDAEKDKQRWFNTHSVLVALQLVAADHITGEANDLLLHGTFAHLLAMQQAMTAATTAAVIASTSSSN